MLNGPHSDKPTARAHNAYSTATELPTTSRRTPAADLNYAHNSRVLHLRVGIRRGGHRENGHEHKWDEAPSADHVGHATSPGSATKRL